MKLINLINKNIVRTAKDSRVIIQLATIIILAIAMIQSVMAATTYYNTTGNNQSIGNPLFIDNSNVRVGIGTTTPQSLLQVAGITNTTYLTVGNLTTASCDVKADSSGNVYCGTDATGGAQADLANLSGNTTNMIRGYDFTLQNTTYYTTFWKITDGQTQNTTIWNTINANKNNAAGWINTTTTVYLSNLSNNVAIGLETPTSKLHINGSTNTTELTIATATAGSCDLKAYTNGTVYCGTDNTGAGGTITGSGTAGTIPLWNGTNSINNSIITQTGTTLTISGNISPPTTFYIGNGAIANGTSSLVIGTNAVVDSLYGIAIGAGANSSQAGEASTGSIAIGRNANAHSNLSNYGSIAIGQNSFTQGTTSNGGALIAIGDSARAITTQGTSLAIGPGAFSSSGAGSTLAIGQSANATSSGGAIAIGGLAKSDQGIAIGQGATTTGTYGIAIGEGSNTSSNENPIAIGYYTVAAERGTVVIGSYNRAMAYHAIALGYASNASGQYSIAIGDSAQTTDVLDSIAIGRNTIADNTESIALGYNANTSANNQLMIGAATDPLNTIIHGAVNTTGGITTSTLTTASCDVKSYTNGTVYCGTDATGAAQADVTNLSGNVTNLIRGYDFTLQNTTYYTTWMKYTDFSTQNSTLLKYQQLNLVSNSTGLQIANSSFANFTINYASWNSALTLDAGNITSGILALARTGSWNQSITITANNITGGITTAAGWTNSTTAIYQTDLADKVGIGVNSPQNLLDVEGGAVIGAAYSGTNTAPTNGLLIQGNVGIEETTPLSTLTIGDTSSYTNDSAKLIVSDLNPLPNIAGAMRYNTEFRYLSGNTIRLLAAPYKRAASSISDWSNTSWRLQLAVDNSFTAYNAGQAYIELANAGTTGNDGYIFFGTEGADRVTINDVGFVGINTTAPAYQLQIAGTGVVFATDNGAIYASKNTSGSVENFMWPRWTDNIMYMNFGSAGLRVRNVSGSIKMEYDSSKNWVFTVG